MGSRLAALMPGMTRGMSRAVTLGVALGVTLAVALPAPQARAEDAACRDDTIWLRGDFGKARFTVDIADDPAERAQGLMFVETMPASRGMLFVYPDERPGVAFWMKNTLIPLDIVYADAAGRVVRVHANAIPGDETALPAGAPVQYVLEINGGLAARLGIGPGAEMRHPAIAAAAWPCD